MTKQLLAVEDSAVQAALLQQDLEDAGYTVTVASDAEEALEILERGTSVDLIVTDVMMPGMTGFELCRNVKALADHGRTPVLLLTSLSDPENIVRGLECGADSFLTKPYDAEHLLQRIETMLRSADQRAEGRFRMGVDIEMLGHTVTVSADRQQILDMLMASFEELITLNAQLVQARREAVEANAAKSEYLARLSHEIRTPLNSVIGFSQLLEWDQQIPESARDAVGRIQTAGHHLLRLVEDVLDIARIEAGHMVLEREDVAIDALIAAVVQLLRPQAEDARVTVEVLDETLTGVYVLADPQRLSQVLVNLVGNAIKYIQAGGRVRISGEARDDVVEVSVADDGPGIHPDLLDRLFEPFDRLGAERHTAPGTGLGLPLSRHLVELMDGTLTVATAPGEGASFTITLPRTHPDDVEPHTSQSAGGWSASLTVVHVDDDPASRSLIASAFAHRSGWELVCVGGDVDVATVRGHAPDAVVLDLDLVEADGLDLLERLRRDPALGDVPILAISADARLELIADAHAAGADEYLAKPLDLERLLRRIDGLVRVVGPDGSGAG